MANAEELFAAVDEKNSEEYIVIGNDRHITIPANLKRLAVQFDHNIETVTFKCPRYWDNHDMSEMAVYVNYMRSDGYKDRYPVNVDENGHIQSVKAEGDVMFFNWTISRNVTQVKGNVSFLICVMKTDAEGNEERHWNSELSNEAYISEGMECEESPVDIYPDIITQLLLRMNSVEQNSGAVSDEQIENAVNKYLEENPVQAVDLDTTLSKSGQAADAKAVGDKLGSIESAKDAVLYTAQELTEEQQAQARANIGVDASGTTVDGTLTQHGVAADAGSVGDMLHAELSYSVTDSVKAGSDYKGYYNGKRVDVFIPAYTDFDIIVETDAFDTSILYCYQNETTNMAFGTDFPSNTRRTCNTYYDITGITLYAKSADITQSGDFTIKVTLKNKDGIEYRLANAELGISKSDILNLNPQDEMLPLFQHAKGSTEEGGNYGANRPKCLVLAHFSDIHGDGENLNRIVRFTDTYKDYIDDVVCTGDIARDNASSNGVEEDFSWWSNNGGENVLMTIGNHDTNVVVGTTSNWRDYGKVNTYNKYFAPFIDNWGVTQPSDAASGGKCYYYKDYPAYNIRVIALDCMYYDADHDAWFVDVLADARTKGYAVITMAHALGDSGENIECTYSAINTTAGPALLDSGEYIFCANVHSRIDDFIAAGGTFICFLGGHYHRDLFGLVKGTDNKQLYSLAACAGSYAPGRDFDGTIGTRSQDCFNIVAVDPTLKLVKLFKVGCQYDNYMRQKGTLCYNYETHKLVYNGGGSSSDVGDIDAALNAIVEIQNNLIGGDGA